MPTGTSPSWDYWLVPQELKFKVSWRSEFNWQRYREIKAFFDIWHRRDGTGQDRTDRTEQNITGPWAGHLQWQLKFKKITSIYIYSIGRIMFILKTVFPFRGHLGNILFNKKNLKLPEVFFSLISSVVIQAFWGFFIKPIRARGWELQRARTMSHWRLPPKWKLNLPKQWVIEILS